MARFHQVDLVVREHSLGHGLLGQLDRKLACYGKETGKESWH
jgi:hypothetical protein